MIAVAYTKLLRRKRLLEPTQTAFHILAAVDCGRIVVMEQQRIKKLILNGRGRGGGGGPNPCCCCCWPRAVLASHRSQVSPRRPIPFLHINIRVLIVLIHFAISHFSIEMNSVNFFSISIVGGGRICVTIL